MKVSVEMVFWEPSKGIPEVHHTLQPLMMQRPNAKFCKQNVGPNCGTNPNDHADHSKKIFL
jgi:hypothetical protein